MESNEKLRKAIEIAKKVRPLHDRVIIISDEADTVTAGGIIIPDTVKEKPKQGTVVTLGTGVKDKPWEVAAGDRVLYGKYAGNEVEFGGVKFLLMREGDIFAIVESN